MFLRTAYRFLSDDCCCGYLLSGSSSDMLIPICFNFGSFFSWWFPCHKTCASKDSTRNQQEINKELTACSLREPVILGQLVQSTRNSCDTPCATCMWRVWQPLNLKIQQSVHQQYQLRKISTTIQRQAATSTAVTMYPSTILAMPNFSHVVLVMVFVFSVRKLPIVNFYC